MEANKTIIKNKKTVRELIEHLNRACQEGDEAKGQIHKLLNNVGLLPHSAAAARFSSIGTEPSPTLLLKKLNRANSSITESTGLFYAAGGGSCPADSFIDTVSLSDFSTFNLANNSNTNTSNNNLMFAAGLSVVPEHHAASEASQIIDGLSQGKALPQKGRLLEAVMAAGPLLQTLFVAGPLPQWRNPPPTQPLKLVPPVLIKGGVVGDCGMLMNQKVMAPPRSVVNPSPTYSESEMSCGGSNSMLNSTNGHSSGTCPPDMPLLMSASSFNGEVKGSKRLRFQ